MTGQQCGRCREAIAYGQTVYTIAVQAMQFEEAARANFDGITVLGDLGGPVYCEACA